MIKMSGWKKFDELAKELIDLYIKEEKKDKTLIGKIYAYKGHQILVEPIEP